MRSFYIIVISVMLIVLGMLFYPTVHTMVGGADTTGFLPLTTASLTFLPYAFLAFILYAIFKTAK